ncbi:MAG: hypothetical protein GF307_13055 [candidate division Zixibacteria bacterium]|nr:hypothetical protein [candidate division Zixibacteria bacterium]
MKKTLVPFIFIFICLLVNSGCEDRSTSSPYQPELAIVYPGDGDEIGDSVTVRASAGELQNVISVDFYADGSFIASDSSSPYRFFWSTHQVDANQSHELYVKATTVDSAYYSDTITVTIELASGLLQLSEHDIVGNAVTVALDAVNGVLYAASSGEGVKLYDVSNPYNIAFIANIAITGNSALGITHSGNFVFIAEGTGGVSAWDVSDTKDPQFLDIYDTPGNAVNVEYDNTKGIVYCADTEALQVVGFNEANGQLTPLARLNYTSAVNALALNGDYIHLAVADGIKVVDVSNPSNPSFTGGNYSTDTRVKGIASIGSEDYIAEGAGGIAILSIVSPDNLEFIADYNSPPDAAEDVAIESISGGKIVYIADGAEGLTVARYTESSDDIEALDQFDTQGSFNDIIFNDGLLYAADRNSLRIMRFVE